jgi:hypothetical protein
VAAVLAALETIHGIKRKDVILYGQSVGSGPTVGATGCCVCGYKQWLQAASSGGGSSCSQCGAVWAVGGFGANGECGSAVVFVVTSSGYKQPAAAVAAAAANVVLYGQSVGSGPTVSVTARLRSQATSSSSNISSSRFGAVWPVDRPWPVARPSEQHALRAQLCARFCRQQGLAIVTAVGMHTYDTRGSAFWRCSSVHC